MNRPAPIAYADHAGRLRCPTCAVDLLCGADALADAVDGNLPGVAVAEVQPWNIDDVEPGGVVACIRCGAVVYREPDALDTIARMRGARQVVARVVEVDWAGRSWQVRDSLDLPGYLLAVVVDGADLPARYVPANVDAGDLLDALDVDAVAGIDYRPAP